MAVITYPWWDQSRPMLVKEDPDDNNKALEKIAQGSFIPGKHSKSTASVEIVTSTQISVGMVFKI